MVSGFYNTLGGRTSQCFTSQFNNSITASLVLTDKPRPIDNKILACFLAYPWHEQHVDYSNINFKKVGADERDIAKVNGMSSTWDLSKYW